MGMVIKEERINLRSTPEIKKQLSTAAALLGMTLSEFILSVTKEKAEKVIHDAETITLSHRDRDKFLDLLDTPPHPNKSLMGLAKRHKKHLHL